LHPKTRCTSACPLGGQTETICDEIRETFHVNADYLAIDLAQPNIALKVAEWLEQKTTLSNSDQQCRLWTVGNIKDIPRDELNQMMQLNMLTWPTYVRFGT